MSQPIAGQETTRRDESGGGWIREPTDSAIEPEPLPMPSATLRGGSSMRAKLSAELTFLVSPELEELLGELVRKTGKSKGEVFAAALFLLNQAIDANLRGGRIVVQDPTGEREIRLMPSH